MDGKGLGIYNTIHYIEEGHNGRDGKARREIVLARKDCLARGAANTSLFTKCSVVSRRRVWWRCDQNMYLSACMFLYTHNENIIMKVTKKEEEIIMKKEDKITVKKEDLSDQTAKKGHKKKKKKKLLR